MTGRERRRGFGVWVGAATASTVGDSVTGFALGWVASGLGAHAASLVLTVEGIPLCLLILLGGSLADRYGVRRVMVACDAAMALVMAGLALASLSGTPLWLLVVVGLLAGTAAALRRPAEGVLPRLFSSGEDLAKRMAVVGGSLQVARTTGPVVGGVLVGLGGLPLTSALDTVTFVVVMVVLLAVRPPREGDHVVSPPGRGLRSVLDGAGTARRTPGVPGMLLAVTGVAATVLPLVMLCVPLLGRERGWSASTVGVVAAAWIGGGIVVTLVVARRGAPGRALAVTGPLLAGSATATLAVTTSPALSVAAMSVVGIGTCLFTAHLLPAFVTATPPDMLARFQALAGLAQTGPVLVATPLLGAVAAAYGPPTAVVVVAIVLALTAVPVARMKTGSRGGLSLDPPLSSPGDSPAGAARARDTARTG